MWIKTHSITVSNLEPEQVWKVWSNINDRPKWDIDLKWAKSDSPFQKGAIIQMQPEGGPKIRLEITECIPNQLFTDCYQFPLGLAKLYGIHHMEKTAEGLCLTTSIKVEGPLGWILRKLIGEKVVAEIPQQTEMLVALARTK